MTKIFNIFLTKDEIIDRYKKGIYDDICLLLNPVDTVQLLSSELKDFIFTQQKEGISTNGSTDVYL